MEDIQDSVEMTDTQQLQLETEVRRALLEDAAVPDAREEFLHFKEAHRASVVSLSHVATVAALAAACVLAFVFLTRETPAVDEHRDDGVLVYEGNTIVGSDVSVVVGGKTMSLSASQARLRGISTDSTGLVHISPDTEVAAEDHTTLLVPQGRVASLVLSDGTRVWLSADSRLVFPHKFLSQGPREVALVGEAMFDVAHDESRPFLVNCGDLQTCVLGTTFTVRHFEGQQPRVVLVSGRVSVSSTHGESLELTPGCEASLGTDGRLCACEADIDVATSWARGEFYFDGQTLRDIMIEVGRWYNKSVVFANTKHLDDRLHFNSERSLPLAEIVRQLNAISNVQIEIKGDVLRVI